MSLRLSACTCALASSLVASACYEPADSRPSRILGPRVLAIAVEPAEASPGARATYRMLAVDVDGELTGEPTDFSYCEATRAAGDPRAVAPSCAKRHGSPLEMEGTAATGSVPSDACERFGPTARSGARSADPDASGGYYQPLRVLIADQLAIGLHRILCPLPDAPIDVALAFRDRYVPNENPRLASFTAPADGMLGERITLRIAVSTGSSERYVRYDVARGQLVDERERLRVAWYATGGELEHDRTDLPADAQGLANEWQAPDTPGRVHLWAVLRDDRGGVAFTGLTIDVR